MIYVVIPYFQREPGILRRAIASVLRQDCTKHPIHLIVVDDASPVPAQDELHEFDLHSTSCQIIFQKKNGGPGSARNTGLDSLPKSAKYLAFLDSDDEWAPDHLSRAVRALEQGYDVFFANHLQLGAEIGAFERAGRLKSSSHVQIDGASTLFGFSGDMFNQILSGNLIGTPTVVYDFQKYRDIRFRTDLTKAGEDYLFWMSLAKQGARFSFSTKIAAICGGGVNIFAGAKWASNEFFVRTLDEIKFRRLIGKQFDISASQEKIIRNTIKKLRRDFGVAYIHRLRHGPGGKFRIFFNFIFADPLSLLRLPTTLAEMIKQRETR